MVVRGVISKARTKTEAMGIKDSMQEGIFRIREEIKKTDGIGEQATTKHFRRECYRRPIKLVTLLFLGSAAKARNLPASSGMTRLFLNGPPPPDA